MPYNALKHVPLAQHALVPFGFRRRVSWWLKNISPVLPVCDRDILERLTAHTVHAALTAHGSPLRLDTCRRVNRDSISISHFPFQLSRRFRWLTSPQTELISPVLPQAYPWRWGQQVPMGYDEVEFTITYEDGYQYKGCICIEKTIYKSQISYTKPLHLKKHGGFLA
jgi:hypothetical protein